MGEERPEGYPKLADYAPSRFMLPSSHYDKDKADRAVMFIENLRHTKGKWAGKRFWLLPGQEQLVRAIFGIVKENVEDTISGVGEIASKGMASTDESILSVMVSE